MCSWSFRTYILIHCNELNKQIEEYFDGKRKEFSIPLAIVGTTFQKQAWLALQAIPYGETRSYKEQAEFIGNPKAIRAVARANGDNRIAIIIPCHRVIGANGELVGYGGGLWRKRYLIELEQKHGNWKNSANHVPKKRNTWLS